MGLEVETSAVYAKAKDHADGIANYRNQFLIPKHQGREVSYFCGNSLGLQPRSVSKLMKIELYDWATLGVEGHFKGTNPWVEYHKVFSERLGKIVGAKEEEICVMNSLTVNLHLMMVSFYRPQGKRTKILMEAGAFPSDQYAVETQVRMHGLDPKEAIIEVAPRKGSHIIDEDDIKKAIKDNADSIALVLIGGVNYYTGQYFDLQAIAVAAHEAGAYCGFDLAHAVGNVPLQLHDWNIDFACWCSYKYLNAGPGATGAVFVHEMHCNKPELLRLGGWWGNNVETRFKMEKGFVPQQGAAGWQISNAPVLNLVSLISSLEIFESVGMDKLRKKSIELTSYIEMLLSKVTNVHFEIITPKDANKRGGQLSLLFKEKGKAVYEKLSAEGVVTDWREPNVIRIAPVPLYNTFDDCYRLVEVLKTV